MGKRALSYQQFIRRLLLLEAGIPSLGRIGQPIYIYEKRSYFEQCNGRFTTIIDRDASEPVPVEEIQSVLQRLRFDEDVFWSIVDHGTSTDQLSPPHTSA